MRIKWVLFILLLRDVAPDATNETSRELTGWFTGSPIDYGDRPYIAVVLFYRRPPCIGTIIKPQWVLTSWFCATEKDQAYDYQKENTKAIVYAGVTGVNLEGPDVQISTVQDAIYEGKKVELHGDLRKKYNRLMLLLLNEPFVMTRYVRWTPYARTPWPVQPYDCSLIGLTSNTGDPYDQLQTMVEQLYTMYDPPAEGHVLVTAPDYTRTCFTHAGAALLCRSCLVGVGYEWNVAGFDMRCGWYKWETNLLDVSSNSDWINNTTNIIANSCSVLKPVNPFIVIGIMFKLLPINLDGCWLKYETM